MVGTYSIPVGASNTLSVEVFGFPIQVKTQYYALARAGLRAAWSFGGRIDASIFRGGGGGAGPGDLLGEALPYFQRFQHATRPAIEVISLPKITDGADIDNDNDTAEQVPDWQSFPDVALRPSAQQTLRYHLHTENARLPFVTGGNANTLIVVTGSLLPGIGFVPLGLDGLADMGGNGLVRSFTTRIAPPHSGLEAGEYAVLATAFRNERRGPAGPGSTRVQVSSRLPATVDMTDGWLDSPLAARYSLSGRRVTLPMVPNADVFHVSITTANGSWHLYTASSTTRLDIPQLPMGVMDRAGTATVTADAIDLATGTTLESIADVSAGGVIALDRATRGFASARVTHEP
jgi:hypothetical protein